MTKVKPLIPALVLATYSAGALAQTGALEEEYAAQALAPCPITDMDAYFLAPPKTDGATLRYDF